jgi:hypothetical protein
MRRANTMARIKRCRHCKKEGFNAERYIAVPKNPTALICMSCAVDIYLIVRSISSKKSAITGKLEEPCHDA